MRRVAGLIVALALLSGGCIDIDFDPISIVATKRILAISADAPESQLGQDVMFEVLAVDERGRNLLAAPGIELRWTVCLSLAQVFGGAGLGASVDVEDTCDVGGPDLIALETDGLPPGRARLPAAALLAFGASLMGAGGEPPPLPPGVSQDQLQALLGVIAVVGVPLRARVEIFQDGALVLEGLKRFAITTRADPTTAPPPPRFSFDGRFVSARPGVSGDPRVCVAEDGAPIELRAAADVTLSPSDDEDDWVESYPVFNLTGELQTNMESAFYNWFATGGAFGRDVTQQGDHDVVWTTPETPGAASVWIVVRDGHLGTSWCRVDVTIAQ